MVNYKIFESFSEITHFCTTRHRGRSVGNYASYNLSPFTGDDTSIVSQNMEKLGHDLDIELDKIIVPFQTHDTEVRVINEDFFHISAGEQRHYLHGVDALVTNMEKVCVCITTADCVPILFFDEKKKVVGVAHAGWRGTCGRIAEKTLMCMADSFGCQARDIRVSIGPSISGDVYTVGNELVDEFQRAHFPTEKIFVTSENQLRLDLWEANRWLLETNGIQAQNIEISGHCTYTLHEQFFSARRLGIKSGRMLSGIFLKPNTLSI